MRCYSHRVPVCPSNSVIAFRDSCPERTLSRARAMAMRWRWPPDSSVPRAPTRVSYPSGRRSTVQETINPSSQPDTVQVFTSASDLEPNQAQSVAKVNQAPSKTHCHARHGTLVAVSRCMMKRAPPMKSAAFAALAARTMSAREQRPYDAYPMLSAMVPAVRLATTQDQHMH